ncbi:MAG: 4Fe-4S double cluster binding domain-containing protein [Eubacteriales bacterium]|nr:4Fe-4S double cluster binding domain-containing protein [Eubacteriales bacterium]
MPIMLDINRIAATTAPNLIRSVKMDDIGYWKELNKDNPISQHLSFDELDENMTGVCVIAFQYNLDYPELPEGCMSISPYYYYANKYYRHYSPLLNELALTGKIKILKDTHIKSLANLSGIGFYGKNSIIHNERFGSRFFMIALGLYEDTEWDKLNLETTDCGSCKLCVEACPTQALSQPYLLSRHQCLRHYMLTGIEMPEQYKPLMSDRLVGCDICQKACPKNIRQSEVDRMPDYDREVFEIERYMDNEGSGLNQMMPQLAEWIGKNYARANRVKEQCNNIYSNIKKG